MFTAEDYSQNKYLMIVASRSAKVVSFRGANGDTNFTRRPQGKGKVYYRKQSRGANVLSAFNFSNNIHAAHQRIETTNITLRESVNVCRFLGNFSQTMNLLEENKKACRSNSVLDCLM